jgi:hypothetical protein
VIRRSDELRTQAVQAVLKTLGGNPLTIYGNLEAGSRTVQEGLYEVRQEMVFYDTDGRSSTRTLYTITAEVSIKSRTLEPGERWEA